MKKNKRCISLMLGFVLFVVWMWPAVRSDAATSSELEQSIKEKESAISQAQEEKKQLQSTMSNIQAMVDSLESSKNDLEAYVKQLEEYQKNRELVETCKTALEEEQEVLQQAKAEVEKEEAGLETLISQKEQQITAFQGDISNKEAALKEYEADIAAQNSTIAALEAAAAAERKQLEELNKPKVTYDGGMFQLPLTSYKRISDEYGYRMHPTLGVQKFHNGVDFAAPSGTPILADYGGTVVGAAYNSSMGNYVMINHGDGLYTIYMHASALYVSQGQTVSKGEQIAAVGSTGRSTGPHLHFSVRVNGEYVNPWNYLK